MEISKKSLHYRLNSLMSQNDYRIPDSLCPYFWYTILSGFKALVVACVAGLLLSIVCYILAWFIPSLSIYWTNDLIESFFAWLLFGLGTFAVVHAVVKEWHEDNYRWEYYPEGSDAYHYRSRERVLKKPIPWFLTKLTLPRVKIETPAPIAMIADSSFITVTIKFIRAWHDKVCPSITFVNPDKKAA